MRLYPGTEVLAGSPFGCRCIESCTTDGLRPLGMKLARVRCPTAAYVAAGSPSAVLNNRVSFATHRNVLVDQNV
jgi:hypothetical protein